MTITPSKSPRRPIFITWLRKQAHRDDPVGDLAGDTVRDIKYAKARIDSYESLRDRICICGGISSAVETALRRAKAEYDAYCYAMSPASV